MWEHSFHAEQTRRPRCPTLESPVGVCAGARVARQKPVTRVSGACGDRSAHRQPQALKGSSDGRPVNGDRAPSPESCRRGRLQRGWRTGSMHGNGNRRSSPGRSCRAAGAQRRAAKCSAGHPNVPEIRGVTDIEQDSCCGPDPDVWHHGCAIHRSDIMFIIGHSGSGLESDRGRGARRDRPGPTDPEHASRRPPGCGPQQRGPPHRPGCADAPLSGREIRGASCTGPARGGRAVGSVQYCD